MSQLKVNGIRHTSASSDSIELASDGTCTAKITNRSSNIIVNGSMNVSQRGSSFTSSDFGLDRWKVQWSGQDEALTHAQHALTSSDTGPWAKGFRNSLHITNGNQTSGAGAADYANIRYVPEAQDLACSGWDSTSSSSKLTLSFWVKSSVAQNFYVWIYNGGGSKNYVFETGSLSADTWTKVTKTIPGASGVTVANDNTGGLTLYFSMFEGTDRTASMSLDTWATYSSSSRTPDMTSTWWTTNDATFEITGVQLTATDYCPDYPHISYGSELARCQRYFWMAAYGNESAAGNGGSGLSPICTAAQHTTTDAYGVVRFPTRMRAAPSIYKVESSNYWAVFINQTCDSCDTVSINRSSTTAATIGMSGNLSVAEDQACWFATFDANARLGFQAEL